MQKPLGAHQKDLMIVVKKNATVRVLQIELCFMYWKFEIVRSLLQSMNHFHHLHIFTPIVVSFPYLFAQ